MSDRESLYYDVKDAMAELHKAIRLIAKITMHRLAMTRGSYPPELWTTGYQSQFMQAFNLSQHDCFSEYEAKIAAMKEAKRWLELYGGSWQRKKRGLEQIELEIKCLEEASRMGYTLLPIEIEEGAENV